MPWDLIGNERAINAIRRSVTSGRAHQAYLFSGPAQTGRATAAMLLAKALNCAAPDPPCDACESCRRIGAGIHADVQTVTVELADDGRARRDILVEQIREVEKSIALAPYEGQRRVVIIDPAEAMNDQAQNAFLKSLEEPPPYVVFVLIATDASRLLETVRSRCTPVSFSLVPAQEIASALSGRGTDAHEAALIARLASGRPGWALTALEDPGMMSARETALDQAHRLPSMSLRERFDLAQQVAEAFRRDRQRTLASLGEWASWWRDVMVIQSGADDGVVNSDRINDLEGDAAVFPRDQVRRFVGRLVDAGDQLKRNVQARIALDTLMLRVPARQ